MRAGVVACRCPYALPAAVKSAKYQECTPLRNPCIALVDAAGDLDVLTKALARTLVWNTTSASHASLCGNLAQQLRLSALRVVAAAAGQAAMAHSLHDAGLVPLLLNLAGRLSGDVVFAPFLPTASATTRASAWYFRALLVAQEDTALAKVRVPLESFATGGPAVGTCFHHFLLPAAHLLQVSLFFHRHFSLSSLSCLQCNPFRWYSSSASASSLPS